MGRYDKIKVYHNGSWKTPTYCKIYYAGTWKDLGADTSFNTNSGYVYTGSTYKRFTLNRHDYERQIADYVTGSFKLKPANGFCYQPSSSQSGTGQGTRYDFFFRATVTKLEAGTKQVFKSWYDDGWKFVIEWLDNGKLQITTRWNWKTTYSFTTSNAVTDLNTPVYINVYANKSSSHPATCWAEFGPVGNTTKTANYRMYGTWRHQGAKNQVGSAGLKFTGTLSCKGVDINGTVRTKTINMDTAEGSGSDYEGITRYVETETITEYI